jgi:hypothetical protein
LHEVVELLVAELSTASNHPWENLAEHKKKKVVLVSRFQAADWTSEPMAADSPELVGLKSLAIDLENQSRQKLQKQIELIERQILALQDQHQYLRECLSLRFQKYFESPSSQPA